MYIIPQVGLEFNLWRCYRRHLQSFLFGIYPGKQLLASEARRNELHAVDIIRIIKVNKDLWTKVSGPRIFNPKTGGGNFKGFNVHSLRDGLEPEGTVNRL